MNDLFHKILTHLYENAVIQKMYNISPFLKEVVGNNSTDPGALTDAGTALGILISKSFIVASSIPLLGRRGNGSEHNTLDDHPNINIIFTHEGKVYISKKIHEEKEMSLLERQTDSLIKTNESVAKTNESIKYLNEVIIPKFNTSQIKIGNRTMLIAAISALAIIVSVYVAKQGVTSEDIKSINIQLQKNTQLLDSIQQYQKGIDASLRKAVKDSFYQPRKPH